MDVQFNTLVGKTLTAVENVDDERIVLSVDDGSEYTLFHSQDCCEEVKVESVVGDLSDLVGTPILMAEEASNSTPPRDYVRDYVPDSETWTFYKLRTIKGSVDIRWHGTSNGYYSESVSFAKTEGSDNE